MDERHKHSTALLCFACVMYWCLCCFLKPLVGYNCFIHFFYAASLAGMLSLLRRGRFTLYFGMSLVFCLLNFVYIQKNIYQYACSSYPELAQWLSKYGQEKPLVLAGSINAKPFLTSAEEITFIRTWPAPLPDTCYIVWNKYALVANFPLEELTASYTAVQNWPERTLHIPYLYFEHSQFTGQSFHQSFRGWQKAQANYHDILLFEHKTAKHK